MAAETQTIDGKKVVCEDGVCMLVDAEVPAPAIPDAGPKPRMAQGYMDAGEFAAFIEGGDAPSHPLAGKAWWLTVLMVLFGGLCMNLTPCVLPMIPVNLMIIGRSAARGALYGLGIAIAYGTLGAIAAAGGMAFGEIQGNPWFNAAISALFLALALAMAGVFFIDFSKRRNGFASMRESMWPGAFAFFMGAVSAVLAGACVAPVLIAVLLLTADLVAKGSRLALGLPFVLGIGMALPWPFVGAGLRILPKPGAWMEKVNKAFAIAAAGFAAWYGYLAWTGFSASREPGVGQDGNGAGYVSFASPEEFSLDCLKRPVLVDCWATWCKNCSAMDRKVLPDPRVADALEKRRMTLVKLQAEDIAALRKIPGFSGVMGLPAFLVFE